MSNRELGHQPETIISASVKVEGDFVSKGNVLIEGEVEGSLTTEQDLRVGEHALIAADVKAVSATIAGEVRGNIDVSDRLQLEPTAKIFGDIKTSDLTVASGAVISGKIVMGEMPQSSRSGKSAKVAEVPEKSAKVADRKSEKEAVAAAEEELKAHVEAEAAEEEVVAEKDSSKKTINAFFTR